MKAAQSLLLLSRRSQLCNRVTVSKVMGRPLLHTPAFICQPMRTFHITSHNGSVIPTGSDSPAFADVPGVQTAGEKMIIMFTCTVCDTRSARKISKQAYNEGIVMVRCDCCKNRHLIADRMGVFEDSIGGNGGWDIQSYLQQQEGQQAKTITDENVFELTMEDIMGAKAAAAYHEATTAGNGSDDASKSNK